MALPLADESVDGVVISFGLRNVADPDAALREFGRVTRPGGTLVVCEFSSPTWAPFRTVYTEYLMRALPRIARTVSSNPDAYVYLAESIRAWPDQRALAARLQAAGWADVAWRDLTGGDRGAAPRPQAAGLSDFPPGARRTRRNCDVRVLEGHLSPTSHTGLE
jgi:demethylmenaquinone methyltransferase/2-methoxy-6-polyprenyl-1,4-benzoquinol methylase